MRRYVSKMTGLSRAQVTRLIGQYRESGEVKERVYRRQPLRAVATGGRTWSCWRWWMRRTGR